MFDFDRRLEIWQTLSRHKLRTTLTAFCVSWGIFMLIVMLGVGKGVERGVMSMYGNVSTNSVWVHGGKTLMPFRGLLPGREIKLDLEDIALLAKLQGVDLVAPMKMLSGNYTMLYERKSGSFPIYGINADFGRIEKLSLIKGRQLNELDNMEARKVTVIGARIAEVLFGEKINPLGETILVGGVPFTVIGVYKKALGEQQPSRFFIPLKTLQSAFDPDLKLTQIVLTVAKGYTWLSIKPEAAKLLARRHAFDVRDSAVFEGYDISDEVGKLQSLLDGIGWFVWGHCWRGVSG
ncbi:MAG: ABC transporter permease [Methylococcaceae bacterium]|nr:ABC transporter permease [Methylococcaceae bacterium]